MRSLLQGARRPAGVLFAALVLFSGFACSSQSEPAPSEPAPRSRSAGLTLTLWTEGVEATPPAPLSANDLSPTFEYVNGSNLPSGTSFVGRIAGTPGASGTVHAGGYGAMFRAQASQPSSSGVPTYTYEVRKRINTIGYTNVRLTYWRRLVGFESTYVNGQLVTDRLVVRYSTVTTPGPTDWIEAQVAPTTGLGSWSQGTVEGLPAATSLWISFMADFKPRLNTTVTPSVYQFDDWAYVDDFVLTGDSGCSTSADCSDGTACTRDVCDLQTGVCSNPPIVCDDGSFCTGAESCDPSTGCLAGTAPEIDDGIACTTDACSDELDQVTHIADDSRCDDLNACTADACVAAIGCSNTATPDAPCTDGVCDAEGVCVLDPTAECATLPNHAPCGVGASWCEGGDCILSSACGDGWLNRTGENEPVEACDDGNNLDNDACSPECESAIVTLVPSGVIDHGVGVRSHAAGVDGNGRVLVVWQSDEGGTSRLLARRMTETGLVVVEDEIPIVLESALPTSLRVEPQVVGLSYGGWAVLYTLNAGPDQSGRIAWRTIRDDGTSTDRAILAASDAGTRSERSVKAAAYGEGFVAVWVAERQTPASQMSVRHAIFFDGGLPYEGFVQVVQDWTDTFGGAGVAVASDYSDPSVMWEYNDDAVTIAWTTGGAGAPLYMSNPDYGLPQAQLPQAYDAHSPTLLVIPFVTRSPQQQSYFPEPVVGWIDATDNRLHVYGSYVDGSFGSELTPQVEPQLAGFGTDGLLVGYGYGDAPDADLQVVVPGYEAPLISEPDADALLEALHAEGDQRGLTLTTARNGIWASWRDDDDSLRMSLVRTPGYSLEDVPGCFNSMQRILGEFEVGPEPYDQEWAQLGFAVAASGDRVIAGAPFAMQDGKDQQGAAIIYRLDGTKWTQEAALRSEDIEANEYLEPWFGHEVAIDGDIAAVSEPMNFGVYPETVGRVHVYQRMGQQWVESALISGDADRSVGDAIAISGEWLLIGGWDYDPENPGPFTRTMLVYRRTPGTPVDSWELTQELAPFLSHYEMELAIQGTTAIAAVSDDILSVLPAAHIFELQGDQWVQSSVISFPADPNHWPQTLSLALDGDVAIIGYETHRHPQGQRAEVLRKVDGIWQRSAPIVQSLSGGARFGSGAALSATHAFVSNFPWTTVYDRSEAGFSNERLLSTPLPGYELNIGTDLAFTNGFLVAGDALAIARSGMTRSGAVNFLSCQPALACGDGWLEVGEACDDGNGIYGDGCEPTCELTPTCTAIGESDSSCDYVDDDCDGVFDEDFGGQSTGCGVGACVQQGVTSCANGFIVDSCAPSSPLVQDDFACDGIDEDCDDIADEDCTCVAQTSTLSAHASAGRAFVCGATAVTFFSDGFENGSLGNWSATGNFSASNALAQAGTYSAQAAFTGTPTLRRTFDTSALTTATLSFNVRTRGPTTAGYGIHIRRSTNAGSAWTTIASAPGPFASWQTPSFNNMPISSSLLVSFEATTTDATRFVHYDNIALSGTCATPTYFTTGTQSSLGTNASATATLHRALSEANVWRSGACAICGNGVLEQGEACDDRNRITESCNTPGCQVCDTHCTLVAGQP